MSLTSESTGLSGFSRRRWIDGLCILIQQMGILLRKNSKLSPTKMLYTETNTTYSNLPIHQYDLSF